MELINDRFTKPQMDIQTKGKQTITHSNAIANCSLVLTRKKKQLTSTTYGKLDKIKTHHIYYFISKLAVPKDT